MCFKIDRLINNFYRFHLLWSLLMTSIIMVVKASSPLEIWSVYFDDTLEMIKTENNKVVQQIIHPPFDDERYIIEIRTYIEPDSLKHSRIRRMELVWCEEISMDGQDSSYILQTFSNQSIFPSEDLDYLCLQRMATVRWPNIFEQNHQTTVIKYPENVSLAFSKLRKSDLTFQALLLTIEYDQNYDEIRDHSGFDLYLLTEPTPFEAGIMAVGLVSDSRFFLPPRTNHWSMKGVCSTACLKDRIGNTGHLNIIGIIPSSNHGYLEELSLEIVDVHNNRKTQEIYAHGFTNDHTRVKTIELLQEPMIKSNDKLVVNCNYATHHNKTIKGGFGSNQEHCMVWLHYYPKIDMDACLSTYSLTTLMSLLDVDDINVTLSRFNGLELEIINDQHRRPSSSSSWQIADLLDEKDGKHQWNVEKLIKAKYTALSGKQVPQCGWNPINIELETNS